MQFGDGEPVAGRSCDCTSSHGIALCVQREVHHRPESLLFFGRQWSLHDSSGQIDPVSVVVSVSRYQNHGSTGDVVLACLCFAGICVFLFFFFFPKDLWIDN